MAWISQSQYGGEGNAIAGDIGRAGEAYKDACFYQAREFALMPESRDFACCKGWGGYTDAVLVFKDDSSDRSLGTSPVLDSADGGRLSVYGSDEAVSGVRKWRAL